MSQTQNISQYQPQYKQELLNTPPSNKVGGDPSTEKKDYQPQAYSLEGIKSQLHETAVQRQILDQENANLKQDVEFWQGKVGHAENEKNLQLDLKDQTHRSQVEVLKRTHDNQLNLHQTEIDRLKDHIHEREQKIADLAGELKARMEEIERLKLDNGAKDAEIFRQAREINDLKQIADFKTGENEKLRNDKGQLQLDLYQAQQANEALKDQEQKLFGQIKALRDTIEKIEAENKEAHAIKDANHGNQVQAQHLQHAAEKEALGGEIAKQQALNNQLGVENADVKNRLNGTANELANTQKNLANEEAQKRMWQDKHGQSEKDKAIQLEQARQLRDATVDRLKQNHDVEKAGLNNNINGLKQAIANKEGELANTKNAWVATENNKRNLELAKATLEVQLKDWMKKKDDADRNYQNQIRNQNDVHNNQLRNQANQAVQEKALLGNEINGLKQGLQAKTAESDNHRNNAHINAMKANENDKKFRDMSEEAALWKNQAAKIDREKSAEIDAAHNLRNSQLSQLQKQNAEQQAKQEAEKDALKGVIGNKQNELQNLHNHAGNLQNNLNAKDAEAKQHYCDSQAWKNKAEQEAALRNHLTQEAENHKAQLRNIISDKEKEANNLKQSQLNLQSNLYNTQQDAERKQKEAEAWRYKANDEAKQRSVERGIQDQLHKDATSNMRTSHEAEKDHLHSHIQELHGHVQKKQQEAADWRRSYHAQRYGAK